MKSKPKKKNDSPNVKKPTQKKLVGPTKDSVNPPSEDELRLIKLKRRKEKAELDKKLIDIAAAELKYQQSIGKYIPTELVLAIISHLGKSFMTTYKEGADVFLTEITHRKAIPGKETAELKGILIKLINKAQEKAVRQSKTQVKNILLEFSNTEMDERE